MGLVLRRAVALGKRLLLSFARSRWARAPVGWIFTHMSFAIPVDRLHETRTLIAFRHPRPEYAFHVLLVPKRAITTLMALTPEDGDFTRDLFGAVQRLVQEHELDAHGYRLILNGGSYQDVPHLHFHLISDLSGPENRNANQLGENDDQPH